MALVKVVVEKRTAFKGGLDFFSNGYTYDAISTDEAHLNALADAVVNAEKLIHSSAVDFVGVKVWDIGVPPHYMRVSKVPGGSGAATHNANFYPECAVLVSWPLPRRFSLTRTVRRDLRKWLHTRYTPSGMTLNGEGAASAIVAGTPFDQYRAIIEEPIGTVKLCAPNGDEPTGPMQMYPYLEHRQFPRGRKERP